MKKKLIAWILAAAVVAGGGYAAYTKFGKSNNSSDVKNETSSSKKTSNEKAKKDVVENKDETKKTEENSTKKTSQQTQQAKQSSVPKSQEEIYMGTWVIKREIAYGQGGTFSQEDINNLIGKKLTFSSQKATCFGDTVSYINDSVQNPMYEKSSILKDDFETQNKMTFDKLGISGSTITMVQVKDSSGKGCTFYIKDNNTMILYGGGVYFEIDRE